MRQMGERGNRLHEADLRFNPSEDNPPSRDVCGDGGGFKQMPLRGDEQMKERFHCWLILMVGEYRKQEFVGTPFRDSARGVTRSKIPPCGG